MTDRLAGKTAFITAAGQGIGRATAEAFVREGARVIATDINDDLLADLARATGCETRRLDVTDASAVLAAAIAANTKSTVNVLFNGAGYVHAGTILECDEVALDFSFDLNVRAMYRVIARAPAADAEGGRRLDHQRRLGGVEHQGRAEPLRLHRDQGRGDRHDQVDRRRLHHPGHPLQRDLPGHRRVAVAAPAHRARRPKASGQTLAQVEAAFVARQPMGRLGTTAEIAALAVYLASDESAFTTGTTQVIDGGWSI